MRFRKIFLLSVWTLILLTAFVLHNQNPGETKYFPQCAFHGISGLHCPGCGAARAIHSMLSGDILGALKNNLFLVILAPAIFWLLILDTAREFWGFKPKLKPAPAALLVLLFVLLVLYTVLRNIPGPPWDFLRPE